MMVRVVVLQDSMMTAKAAPPAPNQRSLLRLLSSHRMTIKRFTMAECVRDHGRSTTHFYGQSFRLADIVRAMRRRPRFLCILSLDIPSVNSRRIS